MKTFSILQTQLLKSLKQQPNTACNLALLCNASLKLVEQNLAALSALGVPITYLNQNYSLHPSYIPLNASAILHALQSLNAHLKLECAVFSEIDSTNQYIKNLPLETSPSKRSIICCAEKQTAGRGRFGRVWESPFGENIYFSLKCQWTAPISYLAGLSLVTALALVRTLETLNGDIKIKWPNDLYWQNKKLSGILIETNNRINDKIDIIIGVGLNVNQFTQSLPWCSLYEITGEYHDRNLLIAQFIVYLSEYLEQLMQHSFTFFLPLWNKKDYLYKKEVQVKDSNQILQGKVLGVNDNGFLIIEDTYGQQHYISAGEASLQLSS